MAEYIESEAREAVHQAFVRKAWMRYGEAVKAEK